MNRRTVLFVALSLGYCWVCSSFFTFQQVLTHLRLDQNNIGDDTWFKVASLNIKSPRAFPRDQGCQYPRRGVRNRPVRPLPSTFLTISFSNFRSIALALAPDREQPRAVRRRSRLHEPHRTNPGGLDMRIVRFPRCASQIYSFVSPDISPSTQSEIR